MERVTILGVTIDPLTMEETVEKVQKDYIDAQQPLHLMGVNADKILKCHDDPQMMKIVNGCGIINADGASVVLAGKKLGIPIPERVAGIDLMVQLLQRAEKKGQRVYFFGAKEDVVTTMIARFQQTLPNLNVVGYRNGYFTKDQLPSIQADIVEKQAQLVFVGITSPIKEQVIETFLNNGVNSVFMGVGGSFDVLSGKIKRAPLWMQKHSLEWLYRLIQEPRRLFKRNVVGNVRFLCMLNRVKKEQRDKTNKGQQ